MLEHRAASCRPRDRASAASDELVDVLRDDSHRGLHGEQPLLPLFEIALAIVHGLIDRAIAMANTMAVMKMATISSMSVNPRARMSMRAVIRRAGAGFERVVRGRRRCGGGRVVFWPLFGPLGPTWGLLGPFGPFCGSAGATRPGRRHRRAVSSRCPRAAGPAHRR